MVALKILIDFFLLATATAVNQYIEAQGQLWCDNRTEAAHVHIKLMEKDWPDPYDILAVNWTNSWGDFLIHGMEDEVLTIDPFLVVEHHCFDEDHFACLHTTEIPLNKEYVFSDKDNITTLYLGEVYLLDKQYKTTHVCTPKETLEWSGIFISNRKEQIYENAESKLKALDSTKNTEEDEADKVNKFLKRSPRHLHEQLTQNATPDATANVGKLKAVEIKVKLFRPLQMEAAKSEESIDDTISAKSEERIDDTISPESEESISEIISLESSESFEEEVNNRITSPVNEWPQSKNF